MDRNKEGIKAGIVGVLANTILFISKVSVGLISGSVSIVADGINNLSDSVSSILTIIAYAYSSKPADKEHPYGHERFEYISGFVISFIMLILSKEIITKSFVSIRGTNDILLSRSMLAVLILSIFVKGLMYLYYHNKAKLIDSEVLDANAKDSRNDVLITSGILLGILLNVNFGLQLDGYIGLVVAGIIVYSAIQMIATFVSELLGERPDKDLVDGIVAILRETDSIHGFHDLMIHSYGKANRYAIVHVEVDERLSLIEAHDIIHAIEETIFEKTGIIFDVHLDPLDIESPEIKQVVRIIKSCLRDLDARLSFHDVRIHEGVLLFDVVNDPAIKISSDVIHDIILECLIKEDLKYTLEIQFDALDLLSE